MSTMEWAPEAKPQCREKVDREPPCPSVVDAAAERGITSIVHFTTIEGLKGILAIGAVKTRTQLRDDELVKYVYEPNTPDRTLDREWLDYINLSVTGVNTRMMTYSDEQRDDAEWVILEFGPEILGDGGVVFSTTNNIYPAARRGRGLPGFERMFAPKVSGWYGRPVVRGDRPPNQTTDPQAEVLYPFELPLTHLHTVTVADDDGYEAVEAALSHFPHAPKINMDPKAFR